VNVDANSPVWYACYGSNLKRERFMTYILGGKPGGSSKVHRGCTCKQPPMQEKAITINHRLYFSRYSKSWQGGVAFIETAGCGRENAALGKMYLITREQFREIFAQENDIAVKKAKIDFDRLTAEGRLVAGRGRYNCLLRLGNDEETGHPIFTFTSADERDVAYTEPSGEYLETIVDGICQTYPGMNRDAAAEYLNRAIERAQETISPIALPGRAPGKMRSAAHDPAGRQKP